MPDLEVTNIVFAGLGGHGVLRASDILSEAVFRAGFDVKKSEIHGMSQRGGSVSSDVRFGERVLSPMVPAGAADYLIVLHPSQVEVVRHMLRDGGVLLTPASLLGENVTLKDLESGAFAPVTSRNFNVGLLGLLSTWLPIGEAVWQEAIRAHLPAKVHAQNIEVFAYGRSRRALLKEVVANPDAVAASKTKAFGGGEESCS